MAFVYRLCGIITSLRSGIEDDSRNSHKCNKRYCKEKCFHVFHVTTATQLPDQAKKQLLKNVIIKVINRVATYFYNIFHRIAEMKKKKKVTCKYVDLCLFIDTTTQLKTVKRTTLCPNNN